ncbi:ABC transporter permease subunit [Lutispora saccharofermentans]|uniref:ABC transporter permease n=1 Tax=Lutispora saccharofermentans TaxID=3024236 RepID=A0ABT1NID0_9FIRM|nr:ABC transporter permease [Lutispora saccharofermentans]MCQ1531035.1 ABC transporter permease [Lutispora saccharofermentans]
MKNLWKNSIERFGHPKVYCTLFLMLLLITAFFLKQDIFGLICTALIRIGQNSILVLAMVPCIVSGTGPNFALSIGMICGALAGCISIELNMTGMSAFMTAILIAIPISVIAGLIYSIILNRVKGDEMTVGTYMGYSVVSLMCIGWLIIPFKNPEMIWAIGGKGLRSTISLTNRYGKVLDELGNIKIMGQVIPLGTFVFFGLCCCLMWLFLRSKTGAAMVAAGDNPKFAEASGINVDRQRTIGTVLSMVLGAVGILVYGQSYGFIQLYTAPLNMPFLAISAILIGGASIKKASIGNVISGVIIFQSLLAISLPVINGLLPVGSLSEVVRIIVQNGVILYALTKAGGGE